MGLRLFGILVLSALSATITLSSARADDGSWEVRLRGVYLDPANRSDSINALAVPQNAIHINSKGLPDLDIEYFFTPHWSTELVVTYPQTQEVDALGIHVGTFKHLPPVLTLKYDFLPDKAFQPYIGAGVNFTLIYDVNLSVLGIPLELNTTSWGPALQAGFDYKIRDHWYLNADVKWVEITSNLYARLPSLPAQTRVSSLQLDPWLFGIGVGYRF